MGFTTMALVEMVSSLNSTKSVTGCCCCFVQNNRF